MRTIHNAESLQPAWAHMQELESASPNKRQHHRAQFFRIRMDEGFVPVFAFAPQDDSGGMPAIVLDLSEGGAQIVCAVEDYVPTSHYGLTLAFPDPDQTRAPEHWGLRRVWSHEEGLYIKSGFSFHPETPLTPALIAELTEAEHHLLHCVLHPSTSTESAPASTGEGH